MSAARGSGPRWELRVAADRMMREARSTNRGGPTGTATLAAPGFGSVLVTWDRARRR